MDATTMVPLEELEEARWHHEIEVWALVATIDELEWQLAQVTRARTPRPIRGGPPPEQDRWILDLPDMLFAACLGGAYPQ